MQSQHTLYKSDLMKWVPNPETKISYLDIRDPSGQQIVFLSDPSPQLAAEALWDAILSVVADPRFQPHDQIRISVGGR